MSAAGEAQRPFTDEAQARLAELATLGLERRTRLISGPQGPEVLLDGRPVTLLCSNNYLGLAFDERLRAAASEAALTLGVGSGASRLVSGTMEVHRELERSIAEFEGLEGCLLFGSGYLANIGVIGALAGRGDAIFSDELNHASIVDGCRLSRAKVHVYRHLDLEHLDWLLARDASERRDDRAALTDRRSARRLIVTDSVFSMDGDVAPLAEIVAISRRYSAQVVVDEAHATGALGPGGRGALAAAGLTGEVDVLVGTLGKALGSYGAYACASSPVVRYLLNASRSVIFSTAPPPPAIAAASAALQLLRSEPRLVENLREAARALRGALAQQGFAVRVNDIHIVPLVVGEAETAVALCEAAIARGVFAQAIRPPTVPENTSRLRLSAMASHTPAQMRRAAHALREAALSVGLDPAHVGEPDGVRLSCS